ncbi:MULTISPECIES: hypothetical protein [unclassified Agrococcus]|uniref:hypothetical protein n=1 Tax=unclassified Agrococcus TaxID=2615065 RepID=UPI00361CBD0B
MNDDELRERLQAMPEPTTTVDVDAVVAAARRRRRPKVVGVGVAAAAGCLAFLAPVVVPGLLGPDPVTATLQEQGVAEQAPAGSAPEATDASGGDSADEPGVLGAPGEEATTAAPSVDAGTCALAPAGSLQPGLALAFAGAPSEGTATLVVENLGDATLAVRIGDVGIATLDGATVAAAASVDPASALAGVALTLAPGDVQRLDVDVASDLLPCRGGDPAATGAVAPVVAIATGASAVAQGAALGTATP